MGRAQRVPLRVRSTKILKRNRDNYENIKKGLQADIVQAMQGDADPTDLRDFVLDLTNYYKGNTAADLDEILDKWSTTRETWEERWEAKKEGKW